MDYFTSGLTDPPGNDHYTEETFSYEKDYEDERPKTSEEGPNLYAQALYKVLRTTRCLSFGDLALPRPTEEGLSRTAKNRQPTHYNNVRYYKRVLDSEGNEDAVFDPLGARLQELQIWYKGTLTRFHGRSAYQRLICLSPSVFTDINTEEGARPGIGRFLLSERSLVWAVSAQTWGRCFSGGLPYHCTVEDAIEELFNSEFQAPNDYKNLLRYSRFYSSVSHVHAAFHLLKEAEVEQHRLLGNLAGTLIYDMIRSARSRPKSVEAFLAAMDCLVTGTCNNEFERTLFDLPDRVRVVLYRMRRIFFKDDSDPLLNCRAAIKRMTGPVPEEGREIALQALSKFRTEFRQWLSNNDVRRIIEEAPLHRANASVLFPRMMGGGAAEMHLMVGLYRLSQGKRSPLTDVFGSLPTRLNEDALIEAVYNSRKQKEEVFAAADWWMDTIVSNSQAPLVRPFLCIFPEREPKSRTFALFDYASQLGGMLYARVLARFYANRPEVREAFKGFRTESLAREIRENSGPGTWFFSLDSAVSTDPLPHEFCLKIFEDLHQFMPSFAQKACFATFSSTPVGALKVGRRPRFSAAAESLRSTLLRDVGGRLMPVHEETVEKRVAYAIPYDGRKVPSSLVIYPQRDEINEALQTHGRVLLKSPTGTGKTVFAASAYRSVIQFKTVASLLLFAESCKHFGIPHNVYYSLQKGGLFNSREEDDRSVQLLTDENGKPHTILTTAFYVIELCMRYRMLAVLDEADERQEQFVLNAYHTKRLGIPTLLMTATPEVLQGESAEVIELRLSTTYVVNESQITRAGMIRKLSNPGWKEKTLIICHSNPQCKMLYNILTKPRCQPREAVLPLTEDRRRGNFMEDVNRATIVISTNAIRSSVTISGLQHVFDYQLQYEDVDCPGQGFTALTLFKVGPGAIKQARGRVGRLCDGHYWTVTKAIKGTSERMPKELVGRPVQAASEIAELNMDMLPQPINGASALVEAFSQKLITRLSGCKLARGYPYQIDLLRKLIPDGMGLREAAGVFLFEDQGYARLLASLEDEDEEWGAAIAAFKTPKLENSVISVYTVFSKILKGGRSFGVQVELTKGWLENYSECPEPDLLYTTSVQRALGVCLWRTVARIEPSGAAIGLFRDFSASVPRLHAREEPYPAVLLGLGFSKGALSARDVIPLEEDAFAWIQEQLQTRQSIPVRDSTAEREWAEFRIGSVRNTVGHETKNAYFNREVLPVKTNFDPSDLPELIESIRTNVNESIEGGVVHTTRGSAMSSTFSFSVLNGFGLAAKLEAESDHGKIFGDDYFDIDNSKEKHLKVAATREALGLQTKWSATGITQAVPPEGCSNLPISVFTERFWSQERKEFVTSARPKGMVSLYHAYHPSALILPNEPFVLDYQDLQRTLERDLPDYANACIKDPESKLNSLEAKRKTIARSIAAQALFPDQGVDLVLDKRSEEELLAAAEQALILTQPSTRGPPAREPQRSHESRSLISIAKAEKLLEGLRSSGPFHGLRSVTLEQEPAHAFMKIRFPNGKTDARQ